MNLSTAIFLINDSARAIRVNYDTVSGQETIVKTLDPDIKVDDYVVVETSTRHGMTVVKVTEVDLDIDLDSNVQIKWVVTKIDPEKHRQLLAQEALALSAIQSAEKRRRKDELRKSLFADHVETLKALPCYSVVEDKKSA